MFPKPSPRGRVDFRVEVHRAGDVSIVISVTRGSGQRCGGEEGWALDTIEPGYSLAHGNTCPSGQLVATPVEVASRKMASSS